MQKHHDSRVNLLLPERHKHAAADLQQCAHIFGNAIGVGAFNGERKKKFGKLSHISKVVIFGVSLFRMVRMNYAVEQSYSFFCVVATLFCPEEARCGNKKKTEH